MATTLTLLLITTLTVARLTRLITIDKLAEPLRRWIIRYNGDDGWWTYLFHCSYCLSIWIAAALTPTAWILADATHHLAVPTWYGLPATALAVAYLAAILITKENN
ncbi:hypothetical protein B842_03370 [Corynebacterium humireducens NBRC 106098 = DSM 45392]|uniref:Uncharacterized protein n=1 Tax=Corynebacterium humireducens NBRC 106098 = DSM 45392 TaxID=1223515 RepID=A0A0B5D5Y9_9CORY|nr:hypothetical protein [Corynebacterium humireducens]AJE32527.1 hypothetical protein B842_03370 [Corynebacterium humireducens NBRC 106098 = DSM 45392]